MYIYTYIYLIYIYIYIYIHIHTYVFIFATSEHAYLCAHQVTAFSSFQSDLKFIFYSWYSGRFLQSCCFLVCHMAFLVNPARSNTLSSLRIWCHPVATTLSSALTAFCLFSDPSSQNLSCFVFCLLAAVWEDFFSICFKRALLFVYFPRPAPNHPILRLVHLFRPMLLLWFQ